MSNGLAIAAVTATLQKLLYDRLRAKYDNADVTTLPLDKANTGENKVNLFLYHVALNAAWRNRSEVPGQMKPGEVGYPPLALDLYYLLTAYGQGDHTWDDQSHRLLGMAMSILHDHPLLGRDELRLALGDSNVQAQFERVRITPQPLSTEEVSKLWTAFQTQYRLSVAYQVSLVLIDSTRAGRAALPVLRRGPEDRGADVLAAPSPVLTASEPPDSLPSARLGDTLSLKGKRLDTAGIVVRFHHRDADSPIELQPLPEGTDEELKVQLPADRDAMGTWAAGFYTVDLLVRHPDRPSWATNEVPLAIAPAITITPNVGSPGDELNVICRPIVRSEQRVLLLFGDRFQIPPLSAPIEIEKDGLPATELKFTLPAANPGTYVIRLRVDGADSIPLPGFEPGGPRPLEFDAKQKVTVKKVAVE
jgi:hypothetical protein